MPVVIAKAKAYGNPYPCHPKTDSLSGSTVAQAGGLVLFNLKDSGKVEELVQEKSKVNG